MAKTASKSLRCQSDGLPILDLTTNVDSRRQLQFRDYRNTELIHDIDTCFVEDLSPLASKMDL